MSDLAELLERASLRTVLVVDDGFDSVPLAAEIPDQAGLWASFFDDLNDAQKALLAKDYPAVGDQDREASYTDDQFVASVWKHREGLGDLAKPVFAKFNLDQDADKRYLEAVEQQLVQFGLECRKSGRAFATDTPVPADIVVIDLFLGHRQQEVDIEITKVALKRWLLSHPGPLPIVILMSRSSRLEAKRDEFRDAVGLLDSGFRILKKTDIENTGALGTQLRRLAGGLGGTRSLESFIRAVNEGLRQASERTLRLFRNLKLSDLAQVKHLLLEAENEPLGSYLVEILDRVLLHEIENQQTIIDAAKGLAHLSDATVPLPFVAGSPDLQQLVARVLAQNNKRLELRGGATPAIAFGDLLQTANEPAGRAVSALEVEPDQILLVVTPACDLQHGNATRILMLVGRVHDLSPKSWIGSGDKTSAILLGGNLKYIHWGDTKEISSSLASSVQADLVSKHLQIVGRLREVHALALQQKALANLGRMGQIVTLPGTFSCDVRVFVIETSGALAEITIPELKSEGAVIWVGGRDEERKPIHKLVMTEPAYDGLFTVINAIDNSTLSLKAKPAFDHLRASDDLRAALADGILIRRDPGNDWIPIEFKPSNAQISKLGFLAFGAELPTAAKTDIARAGVLFLVSVLET